MRKEYKRVSVEEFEATNKQNEKWIPEVGQVCKHQGVISIEVEVLDWGIEYAWVKAVAERDSKPFPVLISDLTPIQTPAEKYREEQIERIKTICFEPIGFIAHKTKECRKAAEAFEKGVRVLAPDEFPVKRLTDEKYKMLIDTTFGAPKDLIDAVQNAILGEEK